MQSNTSFIFKTLSFQLVGLPLFYVNYTILAHFNDASSVNAQRRISEQKIPHLPLFQKQEMEGMLLTVAQRVNVTLNR